MATSDDLDLSIFGPIFVLPTRLSDEDLSRLAQDIRKYGGDITDSERDARLILSAVNTQKRALYELRGRGLHLKADEDTQDEKEKDEAVRVVNVEWARKCLDEKKRIPMGAYLILIGEHEEHDFSSETPHAGLKRAASSHEQDFSAKKRLLILERAKADAEKMKKSSRGGPPWKRHHRTGELEEIKSTRRPVIYRKTTEEWNEEQKAAQREEPQYVREKNKYSCLRPTPLYCPNQTIVDCLKTIKLSRILQLDEIGVRAYSTVIAAIQAYPYELHTAAEIQKIPGCDGKASALFDEWVHSHTDPKKRTLSVVQELEESDEFNCLKEFYDIWGVGAKTAREFYFDRGWRSLDDVIEFGWDGLTRVQQIGVKFYDEINEIKIPRDEVERIGRIVGDVANELRPGYQYIITGGHRRGKPMSGDVDMIISHHDPKMSAPGFTGILVERLETLGWVTHTLYLGKGGGFGSQRLLKDGSKVRGERIGHGLDDGLEKAMVVWQEQELFPEDYIEGEKNPNPHRRVDIILAPAIAAGTAVLGWTGGTTFERDMRRYVEHTRSWKFDSGGVWDRVTGKRLNIGSWKAGESLAECEKRTIEDIGLPYFPPELRNTG